jgi:hypothetical protein
MRTILPVLVACLLAVSPAVVSAQPQVMRFAGTVTIDGRPAPDGTRIVVEVQVGGVWQEAGSATTAGGGRYGPLDAAAEVGGSFPPGAPMRFRVGPHIADQTITWEPGALRPAFHLTVVAAPPPPPEQAWRGLQRALVRAWSYEDPRNPRFFSFAEPGSTLTTLRRNQAYLLFLTEDTPLQCGDVTFVLRRGWNLFAWTCP